MKRLPKKHKEILVKLKQALDQAGLAIQCTSDIIITDIKSGEFCCFGFLEQEIKPNETTELFVGEFIKKPKTYTWVISKSNCVTSLKKE